MERLHARYPFLDASREAVEAADVDVAQLLEGGGPAVERGRERVERALVEGQTDAETPATVSDRAELLSYPVARALVSLLDIPGAIEKYAAAEAVTARERFVADFEADLKLKSTEGSGLSLARLLSDFDLDGRIEPIGDQRFRVDVTAYLELAGPLEDDRFRLASRPLSDGTVPVARPELYTLLREAVRRRVADGLPLSVPDPLAASLEGELESLRKVVSDVEPPMEFETVVPGLFPPCMRALLTRAREAQSVPDHSRFSLLAFLTAVGLDENEIIELCAYDGETEKSVRQQVRRIWDEDEGGVVTSPSCAVMDEYGDCVDTDDVCATIDHPLAYYEARLADAPDDRLSDWRDQ